MTKVGMVFPGQGSQTVGMLADIATAFPSVKSVYAEASDALGYDLWKMVQDGPSELLDLTTHTQPALLAASYAIWQILRAETGFQPDMLAGHSLGEYTALVCSGAMGFQDGIKVVAARGRYMQEAVPVGEGALAAIIGLDDDVVQEICQHAALHGEVLAAANFNSPAQVVIAGNTMAVERALVLAKEKGAKLAKLLPVSVPSHCALMKPAAQQLDHLLKTISLTTPSIPVINNVDVGIYQSAETIREGLVKQLFMPVRWVELIKQFEANGVQSIIECGPGKVLTGLVKRIVNDVSLMQTGDLSSLQQTLTSLR